MKTFHKTGIKFTLSFGFVAGLSWYFLNQKGISTEEIFTALKNFGPKTVAVSVFLVGLQNLFMALRIWSLFPKAGRITLGTAIHGVFYGQTVNTFFPARAGDVLKAVIFAKSQSSAATTAAGVIVADKVIDISALLTLVLTSGAFVFGSQDWSFSISLRTTLLIILSVVFIVLIFRFFFRSRIKQLGFWWKNFKTGFLGILDFKNAFFSFLFALGVWICEALTLNYLCEAQQFPVSFSQAVFLLYLLNLAISIPISVGNLGPFEAALVYGLSKLKASQPMAIALAAFYHLLQMITLLGLSGLVALIRMFKR